MVSKLIFFLYGIYGNLIKCYPWSQAFEYLVPCGWCCLGRLDGVALLKEECLRRWTLRFQKFPIIPSSLTLFCACSSRYISCLPSRTDSRPSGPLSQINLPSLSFLGHQALSRQQKADQSTACLRFAGQTENSGPDECSRICILCGHCYSKEPWGMKEETLEIINQNVY